MKNIFWTYFTDKSLFIQPIDSDRRNWWRKFQINNFELLYTVFLEFFRFFVISDVISWLFIYKGNNKSEPIWTHSTLDKGFFENEFVQCALRNIWKFKWEIIFFVEVKRPKINSRNPRVNFHILSIRELFFVTKLCVGAGIVFSCSLR